MVIRNYLKEQRHKNGLSQQKLADTTGMLRTRVSFVENKNTLLNDLSYIEFTRIAKAFNLAPEVMEQEIIIMEKENAESIDKSTKMEDGQNG